MSCFDKLTEFISSSPTPYHTVESVKAILLQNGYTEISEKSSNGFSDGKKHFVIRNGSSIIAFRGKGNSFMITASHSDFPCYKVKCEDRGAYSRLCTEAYGGMMHYTWLDRPLSVAGRIFVKENDGIKELLVDMKKNVAVIPSVAIHMNRGINDGYKFNPAKDLLPLVSLAGGKDFLSCVSDIAGVPSEKIISHDLFLYSSESGARVGLSDEFIVAPRIDDLGCVYASVRAFVDADENENAVSVLAVFDNEEVGSSTKQGADSTFLDMTLRRIAASEEKYYSMLSDSFMVSADNAHALHPNHPELSDSKNAPILGGGVVVKYNANQRYTTDAASDAVFRTIAERASVKLQSYTNRADMPGGSTLGSISNTRVSVMSVDIGIPQLAMHSSVETVAECDVDSTVEVLKEFYSSALIKDGGAYKIIK